MKNHESHPTRTITKHIINVTTFNQRRGDYNHIKRCGGYVRFKGPSRGKYHARNHFRGRGYVNNFMFLKYDQTHRNRQDKGNYIQEGPSRNHDDFCYRCEKKVTGLRCVERQNICVKQTRHM